MDLVQRLATLSKDKHRVLVVIAGVPGSGKTTVAARTAAQLNDLFGEGFAAVVPMDGFHLTRAQLDQMPDPKHAHERRGAPFTFDAVQVVSFAKQLLDSSHTIVGPSFDHAEKDPRPGGVEVGPGVRIVLFEGLYLLYDKDPWNQIAALAHDRWFVDVEPEVAIKRLAQRHLEAGIASTYEQGLERARGSDFINAQLIRANRIKADLTIET